MFSFLKRLQALSVYSYLRERVRVSRAQDKTVFHHCVIPVLHCVTQRSYATMNME